jgi:hypothetical protein
MTPERRPILFGVSEQRRWIADFNSGGLVGDEGRVYLSVQTWRDLIDAGIAPYPGMRLTLSDFDGTEAEPLWLVAPGEVGFDPDTERWYLDYRRRDLRWEPREKG